MFPAALAAPCFQTPAIYACSSATLSDQRSRSNRLDSECVSCEVRTTDLFNDKETVAFLVNITPHSGQTYK
jgi:uncharacterized protein YecE (DUF72 family)